MDLQVRCSNYVALNCLVDFGTVLYVIGSNFVGSSNLRCKFGSRITVGTFSSTSSVRCQSPPLGIVTVAVEVSLNDQDYTTDAVQFTYDSTRF